MLYLVRITGNVHGSYWKTVEEAIVSGSDFDAAYREAGDYADDFLGFDDPDIEIEEVLSDKEADWYSENYDIPIV